MRNCAALFALLGVAPRADAQWVRSADSLTAQAVADSQAVMRDLVAAVRKSPNDAALRYRIGVVAWVLSIRSEAKPDVRGLNGPALKGLADSSLRLATQIEPSNARYLLVLGRFLRSSSDPVLRFAARERLDAALTAARAGKDSAVYREVLAERGRLAWLAYDTRASQLVGCDHLFAPSIDSAATNTIIAGQTNTEVALKVIHNLIVECPLPQRPDVDGDYERAEALFREVFAATPGDVRAFRNLAMLLADKDRWIELASLARDRTFKQPSDAWGWLTLGLALHRSGQSAHAYTVFDTAASRLEDRERERFFAFSRLLSERDSGEFVSAALTDRAQLERSFWAAADPLWSRPGNDPRTEFLSRVTFAELRWTIDEMGERGADSDRGEIHIRYGPPTHIIAVRGCYFRLKWPEACTDGAGTRLDQRMALRPAPSDVVTYWDYDIGITVVFWGAPTYGTARFPVTDGVHIARAIELRSASFDNVAREKILDMPLSITRFRAAADSVDILALSQAPMAAIRNEAASGPVRLDAWLIGRGDAGESRDSSMLSGSGMARVTYRVPPASYVYRLEATSAGTMMAGRTSRLIVADRDTTSGFSVVGFGISDVLFSTAIRANKQRPVRWRDFDVAPVLGAVPRSTNLELLWENYALGVRDGESRYTVAITVQRQRSAAGRVAATILSVAADALGVDRRDDRVTFTFERVGASAPVAFADHVTLSMGDTPAGDYRVTLEITDHVTGRKAVNISSVTVAK